MADKIVLINTTPTYEIDIEGYAPRVRVSSGDGDEVIVAPTSDSVSDIRRAMKEIGR